MLRAGAHGAWRARGESWFFCGLCGGQMGIAKMVIRHPPDRRRGAGRLQVEVSSGDDDSFRSMVESITDCAIVQLDARGRVLSWNKGAQKIKGWSAQEIKGQHVSRFYSREDVERGVPQRELDLAADGRFETEG